MTYPGTKLREHTALESGLIQRVTELEKERDELVRALSECHSLASLFDLELRDWIDTVLRKYPQ